MNSRPPARQSSVFRRLLFGFTTVVVFVALCGFAYVLWEARQTQGARTAIENDAHARQLMLQLAEVADRPQKLLETASSVEVVRAEMFRLLDFHSHVRVRVWQRGELVYNSMPELPDILPLPETEHEGNAWVQAVERDEATGLVVERSHEVDDRWMVSFTGVIFLLRSNIFSLPLLMLPTWFIIRMGLQPLRSLATAIESRSDQDLTPLPPSPYSELSPLVVSINHLMARLRQRIEHEHEFLSDAAHELKTPLAGIQFNAHILQTCGDDVNSRAEAGAGLRYGVARADHLVQQLLSLERARSDSSDGAVLPSLSLETLVRDRLAAAAPLAVHRRIDMDFQADGPCDRPLHQETMWALVDNLVSNAIKYSPDGGRIKVRLTGIPGGGCTLTFSDEGPGIPPELRQRVFERFYRVPGLEQVGSGLGLAIAERAAARNGATIRLEPGPDSRGLLATVTFG